MMKIKELQLYFTRRAYRFPARIFTFLSAAILFSTLICAATVQAEDIEFNFDIPYVQEPPVIESVTNSTAIEGQSFTVFASIEGTEQLEICCNGVCTSDCAPPDSLNTCDWDACEMTDFYGQADPRIVPNPTCIPSSVDTSGGAYPDVCGGKSGNPRLFYYYNGDPTSGSSTDMIYNTDMEVFTAEISTGALIEGDVIAYYIIASDNRGNVIAQVPDPDIAPCTTLTSWDSNYETPSIANCSLMNSYDQCESFKTGSPSCGTNYSVNDPENDTCDENREIDPSLDLDDIIGITGGAGKGFQSLPNDVVVCTKIKLGANVPDVGTSGGPIDTYVMIFFNPDIPDPNPHDVHMTNAIAISYAPEASGADPNLVKVLWDGECVTNPNTADPLGCKLIVGGTEVNELKIGGANAALTFIAKNNLPNGQTILGYSQSFTKMVFETGNMQFDGGTPYWVTDLTTGYSIMRRNIDTMIIDNGYGPAPPIVPSPANCTNDTGTYQEQCEQSASMPASNSCDLTIFKSPDCSFVDEYKVYHNTSNNISWATQIDTVGTDRDCAHKSYSHEITILDGKTHYYWISSVNNDGPYETDQNNWASTKCTVEDGPAPDPVSDFSCSTPDGQENRCECTWTADTISDPSITGFYLWRDDELITPDGPYPAGAGATEYSYTDTDDSLVLGETYTYKIVMEDAGGNLSPEETTTCTPEDLKAPDRVDSLIITLKPGSLGVDLSWEPGPEDDLFGYNAFRCLNEIPGASCILSEQFVKINTTGLIPHIPGEPLILEDTDYEYPDREWCYWIQANDNCDIEGNCPSTGVPNSSSFSTLKTYTKCMCVGCIVDFNYPLFPKPYDGDPPSYIDPDNTDRNILITTPGRGVCELKWHKVCEDDESVFPDCDFPEADMIVGYYIMRAEAPSDNCVDVTLDTNPVLDSMGHLAGDVIHGPGNPSFTDSGLATDTTYCYRVHAYNAGNNFSNQEPIPDSVPCIQVDPNCVVDGMCASSETFETCPADCTSSCGDGFCDEETECLDYDNYCEMDCMDTCIIDPCWVFTENYTTISVEGAFTKESVVECSPGPDCPTGEYRIEETPVENVTLQILEPGDGRTVIGSDITGEDGEIEDFTVCDIKPGENHGVRAKYPAEIYDPAMKAMCANADSADSDGYCVITMEAVILNLSETATISAVSLPDMSSGGGTAISDPDGDGTVSFPDLNILKYGFNTSVGDPCYEVWADFNLDGFIDFGDLNIIKQNFNRNFADVNMGALETDDYDPLVEKGSNSFSRDCICSKLPDGCN